MDRLYSFLFDRIRYSLSIMALVQAMTAMTIIKIKASWYRGSSSSSKKYGAIILPTWPRTLTKATDTARFSGVRPIVLAVQVEMRGLEKYIPPTKMNDAAYRASRLVVIRQMMYPIHPTPIGPDIQYFVPSQRSSHVPAKWKPRSCVLSECHALTSEPRAAKM